MSDETNVIDMKKFFCVSDEDIQADMLVRHARTMIMMFKATGERRYLSQAKLDVLRAKSILRSGFLRPLGVLLAA